MVRGREVGRGPRGTGYVGGDHVGLEGCCWHLALIVSETGSHRRISSCRRQGWKQGEWAQTIWRVQARADGGLE